MAGRCKQKTKIKKQQKKNFSQYLFKRELFRKYLERSPLKLGSSRDYLWINETMNQEGPRDVTYPALNTQRLTGKA